MQDLIITNFVLLWSVIDPIGTIPVFIGVTKKNTISDKFKIATKAVITAGSILYFFVFLGEIILKGMSIPLSAFQIAGGIVLFIFALTMIIGESKPEEELHRLRNEDLKSADGSVFPLAVPSIASPGAIMAAVLLTDKSRFQFYDQLVTCSTILVVLLIQWILLLAAPKIYRIIGLQGASVVSRVMGLILSSVAVNSVLLGIKDFFRIN